MLEFIGERVKYGNSQFSFVWEQLQYSTVEQLVASNASWHRRCYQEVTHIGKLKRARERSEIEENIPKSLKRRRVEQKFTRSQTSPYDKNTCFFCEQGSGYREILHSVSTTSAGKSIRAAVEVTGNEQLLTKLSTAVDANDAHAIDIKYHKNCYMRNVTNVLRQSKDSYHQDSAEIAAKVEFLDITENALREGQTLNMAELEKVYKKVLIENDVAIPSCSRKTLKQLLLTEIPGVEFHRPKRMNESERVTVKTTRDESILSSEDPCTKGVQMKTIYKAAAMLRKCINRCQKWVFTGRFEDIDEKHLPKELYCFFRWIVQGPNAFTSGTVN